MYEPTSICAIYFFAPIVGSNEGQATEPMRTSRIVTIVELLKAGKAPLLRRSSTEIKRGHGHGGGRSVGFFLKKKLMVLSLEVVVLYSGDYGLHVTYVTSPIFPWEKKCTGY